MIKNLQAFLMESYNKGTLVQCYSGEVTGETITALPVRSYQGYDTRYYAAVPAPGAGFAIQMLDFVITFSDDAVFLNGFTLAVIPLGGRPDEPLSIGSIYPESYTIYKPDNDVIAGASLDAFSVNAENTPIYFSMVLMEESPLLPDMVIKYWFTYRIVPV
jgi:hypothetical protein